MIKKICQKFIKKRRRLRRSPPSGWLRVDFDKFFIFVINNWSGNNFKMMSNSRKSQNLIEVVIIIPLLIILLLAIMEFAVFQRNVATVQDIALDAAVAASKYYVDEDITPGNPFNENPAVEAALNIALDRIKVLNIPAGAAAVQNISFNDLGPGFGKRPFALYEFFSQKKVEYNGRNEPVIIFTVDYRDPVKEGVSTQLIYHYSLVLFGLRICYWSGRCITVIPDTVQISSTQTKQYVHY